MAKVLIVEDSATEALRARLYLERAGYQVCIAADGKEGLVKAGEEQPDVIFLDAVMPRMSGYEVWERLRAEAKTACTPVLLLTSENIPPEATRARDAFIAKPYTPTALLEQIQALAQPNGHGPAADDDGSSVAQGLGIGRVILREGRIVALDEAAERLWGQKAKTLKGRPFAERLRGDRSALASALIRVQEEGQAQGELTIDTGESNLRVCRAFMQQTTHQGQPAIAVACLDITGLRRAADDTERDGEELQRLRHELETAHHTKSQFLANMSHELRTPLYGLMGMTDLALGTDLTTEQREYLTTAKASADALLAIVSDMIEFSELEQGQLALGEQEFDYWATVHKTVELSAAQAQEKGLALTCQIAPQVPHELLGDPKRVRQVLQQLLDNAVRFTDKGQVNVQVAFQANQGTEVELHVTVRDTGIGIPEDKLDLVFEAFQQADGSTTRRYGGTGLGLAMAKHLVALMHGRIWVESQVGQGSTFHFTVRLKRPAQAVTTQAVAEEDKPISLSILLAEDSPTNQLIAVANLKKAGHKVTVANNGLKAVEAWSGAPFDLILMDVAMPEMDGLEATRTIRTREQDSGGHIPIVAMTAFALKEYQEKCADAGMDGYVTKPVSPDELRRALQPILAQRRTVQAQPAPAPAAPVEPPVYVEDALEVVGGDADLLKDVVEMSLQECPEQMEALRAAVDAGDPAAVERAAHRLKGVMGNVGGRAARELAQRLETMGEQGDVSAGPGVFRAFEAEMARVTAFFSQPGWEKNAVQR